MQQGQRLEQSPERCIVPDEQAGSVRHGAHDDPALGAGGPLGGTLLCLRLGQLPLLRIECTLRRVQFFREPLFA